MTTMRPAPNRIKPAIFAVLLGAITACTGLGEVASSVQAGARVALQRCEDLKGLQIAAADIGLPTQGATVTSAERLPELAPYQDTDGEHLLPTAPRCLVMGQIASVSAGAPPIQFAVNLPLVWNGRALQSGGGGLGGAIITAPRGKASGRFDPMPLDKPYPINMGYATFGSDGGHSGQDIAFMQNDEAVRNWGGDELKKTRDAALQVIQRAFGRAPSHVFFNGESAGGRESLMAAQRFAADYDGIIATSPVLSWNYIHLADNNTRDHLIRGWLDAPAIKLVANQTRASCDAADGVQDGLIARYLECRNDVAALRCPSGNQAPGCLSDVQIASVNAIRNPWSMAVPMAHGVNRYQGYGVTGDEDGARYQYPFYTVGTVKPSQPLPPGRGFEPQRGAVLNFAAFWVRHAFAQDASFDPYLFDPKPYAERIQYMSTLFDATNPDLSGMVRRRAKLIMVQPSADNAVGLPMVADYYRNVVARMGQTQTDGFMRFYVAVGGGHNLTGPTQVDALTLLENWVLKGEAPPDQLTAYDFATTELKILRTIPACRYPQYPHYNGSGDVNSAQNYSCKSRPDPLEFAAKP